MNSDSFSALPGSIHLDLSSNQLNGSISKFISEMQSIKYSNLANNTLHGVVKGFGSIQTWLNRSDKHGCPFDFHTAGRDAIATNLVAVATSPSLSSSETPTTAITVSSSPSRINSKLKPHSIK
ncbi:hypothetical protein KIW84_071229 [Lathyrus oleraceus]|uniref:Uncharacterized protein n=1 Tax=Pisum sativum TaxID=3888 RepID=A0A9D4VI77_PEA|nr:hypothetical protein KIW84_071229 [Pisum sativum]